jgi:fumarate hydratase class II
MSDKQSTTYRIEKDSMGEMRVPQAAYYGSQTQRAVENFPISGIPLPRAMIAALGIIKGAAAHTNHELGLLDEARSKLIREAAKEVEAGKWDREFPLDIFQTGSGTSSNMNTNEVIATRAKELAKGETVVHPNDHVNMSQSSNDVFPTSIHIAIALEVTNKLVPSLKILEAVLKAKREEFSDLVKTGRTHLQDATPITLGQEFSGYESQIKHGIERLNRALPSILELPLGGTAVGTGLNTPPHFAEKVIAFIAKETGLAFREAENHFEAQAARNAIVELSGQLKVIACSITKVASDLRLMACGPRCGLAEIQLPEVQPGSSIMPGKVNPVIIESVLMVAAQVIGNDAAITIGDQSGSIFELNVMMPMMAHNALQSIHLLATSSKNLAEKCISGITANKERLHHFAEASIATCTSLAPKIGYDRAAQLAKDAFKSGESIRTLAKRDKVLPEAEIDRLLDLHKMTKPGL